MDDEGHSVALQLLCTMRVVVEQLGASGARIKIDEKRERAEELEQQVAEGELAKQQQIVNAAAKEQFKDGFEFDQLDIIPVHQGEDWLVSQVGIVQKAQV